ncbi:MAG: hypothetical protein COB24_10000 [Hyphomicrobiales bacterium]|nr:MAG: hypothetical protein COB24_10000 [Hyphomicrobiales bacterium]
MAFFEALQNTNKAHSGDYSNGNIVLVKDGFCWPALFFTPFWLIFRGMWLILILYIGISMIFWAVENAGYMSSDVAFWAQVGLSILFAFEANFLRKWTLQRGDYRHIGVSLGRNLQEAEVNFFAQFAGDAPLVTSPVAPMPQTGSSSEMVTNPVNVTQKTEIQKSHWKIGGKRKADSVVGMFSDD